MRVAVIVFPGSNCDRDVAEAIAQVTGKQPIMVWHRETTFFDVDLVILPGGFAYGDYLRPGAMAARSSVMRHVLDHAKAGGLVLGICNGFQVLTEIGLLPGALLPNAGMKFICKPVKLKVTRTSTPFTGSFTKGQYLDIPVAHHDGNYFAQKDELSRLEDNEQVVFRYENNPNGSINDIAGLSNVSGNVLGMMPHPERAMVHGKTRGDGYKLFNTLMEMIR